MAILAFKEVYLTSELTDAVSDWSKFGARRLRYDILWAQYSQTAYRNIHKWATAYRKQYGLYKYIRSLYGPIYRLGEFYKAHLWGGALDPSAGECGAIPIATDNEELRPAIAELWKWSNWAVNKDIVTLRGAVLGDIAIQVIDDVERGRVYLDIIYPGIIKDITLDSFNNVRGYIIEETREHPQRPGMTVTYREQVTRDGDLVVYETFLNGAPFAWPENVNRAGDAMETWAESYGFIPMVLIKHNDVGLDWGWSEAHPIRSKAQEADDLASQISDQIRKTISPVWLMKGMKETSITLTGADATTDRPEPGREEMQALWGVPTDGGATAMIAELDFENALVHLDNILKEIERDYPELRSDLHTSSGDASGRALRVARQGAAAKVIQRRSNYDAGLVKVQQMAIALGGFREYDGYKGFSLDSYKRGDLEHSVSSRPVFESDPLDESEIAIAEWKAAEQAVKAGVPLIGYLRAQGWDAERIQALIKIEEGE